MHRELSQGMPNNVSRNIDQHRDHSPDRAYRHAPNAARSLSRSQYLPPRELALEQRIESRLHHLGDEIQEMVDAPYPGLLRERDCVREALDELTSKHTTLLWTARVAKCTEGAVRERLWWDIDRALASLEKIADSLVEH
jgi:hypothetical protein